MKVIKVLLGIVLGLAVGFFTGLLITGIVVSVTGEERRGGWEVGGWITSALMILGPIVGAYWAIRDERFLEE